MTELISPENTTLSALDAVPTTNDILITAQGFSELNLSDDLLKALADMNFSNPSSIQKEAIPQVLSGSDIIAKAPTGSGKTAAFAIPIIEKLDLNAENKSVQSLILCPTRELAIQVHREFEKLTKYMQNISVVSVYGGQNIEKQLNALKKSPQIVVATPGRLMDHLRRGSIKLDFTSTVVLDEADEMLDMGFREDIHMILEGTPENRQTILFSATMAKDILELTKRFQKSPNIVDVTDNISNAPDIEQQYFEVSEKDKIELLTRLLNLHNIKLALVFCNTKSNVDKVVEILKTKGFFSDSLHGDMNQAQREKVMRGFRNGSVEILVATDVAGRGIDVKNVEAVFNYDLPRDDEDYIHRIGRTGRAGTSGIAFSFTSKKQAQTVRRIERANGMQIHKKDIPSYDELEKARETIQENKIKSIIKNEDLSQYKAKIEAMLDESISIIDIAASLLKISSSNSEKKINKDIVFESAEGDSDERSRHRRGCRSGRRTSFGERNNRNDRNRGERSNRSERNDRGGRSDRNERSERPNFSERSERTNREDRSERFVRNEKNERSSGMGRSDRNERSDRNKTGNFSKERESFLRAKMGEVKKRPKLAVSIDEMISSVKSYEKSFEKAGKKKSTNNRFSGPSRKKSRV